MVTSTSERAGATTPTWRRIGEPGARRLALAFLAVLMLLAALMWLRAGRDMTFIQDEWTWIMTRRGSDLDTLMRPHNEHLTLLPVLVYKATWAAFGLDGYLPYRLEVLALHLLCAGLLFMLVERRLGPWAGVIAAGFLLFLGAAWDGLLWGFQIGMVGSTAAGLGALLALDRRDRLGGAIAAILVLCALASTGIGIAVAAGIAVELAWRREWRRLWIVAIPMLVYLIWYVGYGSETRDALMTDNVFAAPQYVLAIASAAVGGVFGPGKEIGQLLVVNAFIAAVVALAMGWRPSPRFVGLLAALLAFWALTAVTRAHLQQPDASRYVYFGGAYAIAAIAHVAPRVSLSRSILAAAALVLVVAVAFDVGLVRFGAQESRKRADLVSAETGALQLADASVPAEYAPDPSVLPDVTAGEFREAVAELGRPGYSATELAEAGGEARARADRILVETGQVVLTPEPGAAKGSGCSEVAAGAEIPVPAAGVRVRASADRAEVRVRLYSDPASAVLIGAVEPKSTVLVRPQDSEGPAEWRVVSTAPVRACPASG